MHGLVALDAADQVIRPAILWNDGRTQRQCEAIEQTVGLERLIALTGNRALAGFTAPKLLWLRDRSRTRSRASAACCCPRTTSGCGCAARRRPTSATHRARCCSTSARALERRRCCEALELDRAILPPALESPAVTGSLRGRAGRRGRRRPGGGRGRRRRHARRAARCRSRSAPAAWSSPRCPRSRPTRRRACTRSATRCRAMWHAMGVMLNAGGALRWLRDATGGAPYDELMAEAARVGARGGGAHVPALPRGRAHAARRPGRARRVRRPVAAPRPRRAGARGARGRGVRAARLAGPAARAGRRGARRARVSGGGAASDLFLRVVASALELPVERVAVDEGAAYGAALLAGVGARRVRLGRGGRRAGAPDCDDRAGHGTSSEPLARFRALYPALRAAPSR